MKQVMTNFYQDIETKQQYHAHSNSSPDPAITKDYDSPDMKQHYANEVLSNNIKTLKQSINSGKHQGSESMLESLEVLDPVKPYENPSTEI